MLEVKNLSINVGFDRCLVDNLSFSVSKGDKLAIIGEEGNGKSTIIKSIVCPNSISSYAEVKGVINTFNNSIGYLEQFFDVRWNEQQVSDFILKNSPNGDIDYEIYENLGELSKIFQTVKLSDSLFESSEKIKDLSGGEKVKLQIVKLLLKKPDILILDEPTNDLDIETLKWLEQFIINYSNPIIFISHDEELLSKTANAILHIEQVQKKTKSKWTFKHIGYDEYVKERINQINKQEQIAQKERENNFKQMERYRQIYERVNNDLNSISRQDPHGGKMLKRKMKSVISLGKRLEREREDFTEFPDVEEQITVKFKKSQIANSKVICDYNLDDLKIQDKVLAQNISLKVVGKEKVVIIGKNGVGKSTLIKKLVEHIKEKSNLKIGYMPQNYEDDLNNYSSVIDYVSENFSSKDDLTKIRTFLGSLKFTKEETNNNLKEISGGQKAKLFLAKLMVNECDVLILDEPTRNLSPLSNPVIRKALKEFDGAIISISHDRKFIKEVATKIYELTSNGLKEVDSI